MIDPVLFDRHLDGGGFIGRQHYAHDLLPGSANTRDAPALATLTLGHDGHMGMAMEVANHS